MGRVLRCLVAWCLVVLGSAVSAGVRVENLTCEYLENPMGLDVAKPRLSWMLQSNERGQKQTAYQLLIADREELLKNEQGNLWDTGKVASDQCVHVVYAGKPLASRTRCFWKVRVWDAEGKVSPWSQPATWEMGLLEASDWKAQWIGRDEPPAPKSVQLAGSSWIWYPEGKAEEAAPIGTRYFRRTVSLPEGREIRKATLYATGDNRAILFVNGKQVGTAENFHAAVPMDVHRELRAGKNVLAAAVENTGAAANPAGMLAVLRVEFEKGDPVVVLCDSQWVSANAAPAGWEKPSFDDSAWKTAQKLGPVGMGPWGEVAVAEEDRRLPARMLRKEFTAAKKVVQSRVYLCGLGYYELHVNGKKISDRVLDPALSDYPHRAYYVAHDVTKEVVSGRNAVGVVLGNGRFYAPRGGIPTGTGTYGFPKLLLQLELRYDDGSSERVVSDASWKLTTEGPIRANNDYDGEEYDARQELTRWDFAGFDDAKWQSVQLVQGPKGRLVAQKVPPMRVTETIRPVAITNPTPGVYVYDMGQNLVGWCRLSVEGPAGAQVEIRHAETLDDKGMLYVANLRSARCTDIYTLKGQGMEVYEPRFTYHGFRFVELRGYPGKPDLSTLQGRVVHTDLHTAGSFTCSQPLVNQIHKNVFWGVRGNYLSIPTDCPQRDERQGWQGDRAAESKGESYLFQVAPLYTKWLDDIRDSQLPDGNLSDVCPTYWSLYSGNVTWPSAYIIIPGTLYRQYGDRRVLEEHFDTMAKWINFMSSFLKDGITDRDTYGDWCVPPEDPKLIHSNDPSRKTPGNLLATAYLYHNLKLMANYARVIGRTNDAAQFEKRAMAMDVAFNKHFFDEKTNRYGNGSQTSQVLPLAFGLTPEDRQKAVFDGLVDNILHKTNGHIGTGLIGGQWLMQTLTRGGRADLAFRIATNRDYPSWGYMVDHGATTVWELWNGDTADPAMNSHNHVMLVGDLTTWLYEDVAGIRSDRQQPGFKHVLMQPRPIPGLDFCKASYPTMYGKITSEWKVERNQFHWNIALPANTSATVFVPAPDPGQIRESGGPAAKAKGVRFVKTEGRCSLYQIGAGTYEFTSPRL